MMKELQRECRKLLQHEDLLRAKCRHELAIKRQNEEIKQQQFEENKHIIARYVITFYSGIGGMSFCHDRTMLLVNSMTLVIMNSI